MQNESTPDARGPVFCGVDTHADSHWLCVLDWRGRRVLSRRFPADAAGYEALAGAIAAAGEPACVAMEGTSSYGAGLTVSVNLFFTSFAKQAHRSRKGGFTGCASVFSPIPLTA